MAIEADLLSRPGPNPTRSEYPVHSSLAEDLSPTANLLPFMTLEIFTLYNARRVPELYSRFASPDHTYTQALKYSSTLYFDLPQTRKWMSEVVFRLPETHCQVTDICVDLVEKMGIAVVWVTMRFTEQGWGPMDHDGVWEGNAHWGDARQDCWPGGEKVNLFEWRRREDGEWKWTKHQCVSAMPPVPY